MQTKLKVVVTAALIGTWGALMAAHGVKAEADSTYRVSVYQSGPGSAELLAGDTRAAISTAENALRLPQPFPALVNLCAAHLVAGDLHLARDYCERAVIESRDGVIGGLASRREVREARDLADANMTVLRSAGAASQLGVAAREVKE